MIKNPYAAFFADDNILFFDECSGNVIFTTDEIGVLFVNLSSINLDDDIFYEDDPKTITHARLLAWHNKLKQRKVFKKEITKELMPEAQDPTKI